MHGYSSDSASWRSQLLPAIMTAILFVLLAVCVCMCVCVCSLDRAWGIWLARLPVPVDII